MLHKIKRNTEIRLNTFCGLGIAAFWILQGEATTRNPAYETASRLFDWQQRFAPMSIYGVVLVALYVTLIAALDVGSTKTAAVLYGVLPVFWLGIALSTISAATSGKPITGAAFFYSFALGCWTYFVATRPHDA